MRPADADVLTVGQHPRPSPRHIAVADHVTPEAFAGHATAALAKGFLLVAAPPLARSISRAGEDFQRLRAAREAQFGRNRP